MADAPLEGDPSVQDEEVERLQMLSEMFLAALTAKAAGNLDDAEDKLRDIVRQEPRLAEPHLELARVFLDTARLEDAEAHARQGLEHLAATGPWTDEIPAHVLEALGHALLAEILRRRADEDDVIFGDPATFHAMVAESKAAFERAAELDPSDDYSSYYAFFLGVEGHGGKASLELVPAADARPPISPEPSSDADA